MNHCFSLNHILSYPLYLNSKYHQYDNQIVGDIFFGAPAKISLMKKLTEP